LNQTPSTPSFFWGAVMRGPEICMASRVVRTQKQSSSLRARRLI
jgi:hypothetical protein